MSSGLLYLAIVGVWAGVLVPMWVRRSDAGDTRGSELADMPAPPRGYGRARARVVARRRRRLSGIVLLFVVTVIIAATGVAPWWIVPVPGSALVLYLCCLRAAAAYDMELAERDRLRAERLEQERTDATAREGPVDDVADDDDSGQELPAAFRDPRVIDFPSGGMRAGGRTRDEIFDQYADDRRAVGDL